MVKQQGSSATMLKSAKLKTKKGSSSSTQSSSQLKGHSIKQSSQGPKTMLAKSKPGFALYSNEELRKAAPKFKGPVNPSQGLKQPQGPIVVKPQGPIVVKPDPFEAMMRVDDVVSQMQLVDEKNKEGVMKSTANLKGSNTQTVSPDIDKNPALPEVRTPFNKRLISSTPDPERLLAMDSIPDRLDDNANRENPPSNLSPQMVTEKDMEANTKTTMKTLEQIGTMLSHQRQNQLVWQQQLEQFKQPVVMKVTEPSPLSAFQPWQGTITGLNLGQGLEPSNGRGMENSLDVQEGHQKAKWVSEELEQNEMKDRVVKSQEHSMNESSKRSEIDSMSYNGYGVTSSQMPPNSTGIKNNEFIMSDNLSSQSLKPSDANTKFNDGRQTDNDKVFIPKSKLETCSQKKKLTSSKINTVRTKSGGMVLPVTEMNKQENSENQSKLSAFRKITNKKPPQLKISDNIEGNGAVKKKKTLHVNLPRDERGMDVPPTSTSIDKNINHPNDDNTQAIPQLGKDAAAFANVSISTCGDEVNSLLSSESGESSNKPNTDTDTEIVSNAIGKGNQQSDVIPLSYVADGQYQQTRKEFDYTSKKRDDYVSLGNNELVMDMTQHDSNMNKNDDDKETNINQNYHDEDDRQRSHRFRLHYLEKMADKTLLDIACRLTLKATAIRDKELRDLIDDMIFHTDATLAREVEGFRSSHAFLIDENNILKKRIHTVNKQLDAKERQERQADMYPTISNNDVMHMERKNLYLRQEKDRLDNQVTNLLEEKAKWLVKQQDLVKTISVKDREILKLEEKHQEDKKSLHKAVDESAKNSQGVHFKLSVADMEITNLAQRLKTKDQEIIELKDTIKDMEEDLKCCTDSRREKNKEIQRLQDLVNTLKMGVDEVMKAYEATTESQPSTTEQRQGIESLRRLVTESISASTSLSNIPEQIHKSRVRKKSCERNDREFSISTSTRQQLPSSSKPQTNQGEREQSKGQISWKQPSQQSSKRTQERQHYTHQLKPPHPTQQQQKMTQRDRQPRDQSHIMQRSQREQHDDWRNDSSHLKTHKKGTRHKHDSGTTLTVEALEDHNRRLSPIDRSLWHSLDTGHVMPPFTGEEPYHSDSEIHVTHSRNKRRMEQDRLDTNARLRQRRRSDDFTDRGTRNQGKLSDIDRKHSSDRPDIVDTFEDRDMVPGLERRSREWGNATRDEAEFRETGSRGFEAGVRNLTDYSDKGVGEELESFPLNGDDESDVDRSRYSVTDYFKKYPKGHQMSRPPQRFPVNSKDYWVDSGTAEDQDVMTSHQSHYPRAESRSHHRSHQFLDLESTSVSHRQDAYQGSMQDFDMGGEPILTSTQRQPPDSMKQPARAGNIIQATEISGSKSHISQPLSVSYPGLWSTRTSQPLASSNDQHATLMSTSLPHSSHHHSERNRRENAMIPTNHNSERNRRDESMSIHDPNLFPRLSSNRLDSNTFISFTEDNNGGLEDQIVRATDRFVERVLEDGRQNSFSNRPSVTFRDPSEDSLANPSQSFQSDFMNGRTSFPPHSSPVNTSDISVSRRATRGSETSQHDFFRGTELSASYSSISETDVLNNDNCNNHKTSEFEEESFNTGIASLDLKIAQLEAKINRTKAVFS